jgi:hypothetical protein
MRPEDAPRPRVAARPSSRSRPGAASTPRSTRDHEAPGRSSAGPESGVRLRSSVAGERTVGLNVAGPYPPGVVAGTPTAGDYFARTALDRADRPWGPVVGERHLALGVTLCEEAAVVARAQPARSVLSAASGDLTHTRPSRHPHSSTEVSRMLEPERVTGRHRRHHRTTTAGHRGMWCTPAVRLTQVGVRVRVRGPL